MRYDTPIYFQKVTSGQLDPTTGDYEDDTIEETKVLASVTDTQTQTLTLIYGNLKQGSKTVRIQNHYTKPFSFIRIKDKRYRVDYSRELKTKQTFILSEVV